MIIDISPVISEKLAVFPGDTPYQSHIAMSFEKGQNLRLGSMTATFHLGAHTDAPNHYHPEGEDIASRDLNIYLGPCTVIAANPANLLIGKEQLVGKKFAPRVLFKTESYPNPNQWNFDFVALDAELVSYLAEQGVVLIGIDTPSVDPAQSKDLPAHNAIYRHNLGILEGIVLSHVPEGDYELIALPLKLAGADASPVRAVLRN